MRSRLYVETSVVSYLTARPGRDVIALAHQELTRDWWSRARLEFELYASRLVVAEAQLGNPDAAAARLAVLEPVTLLNESPECRTLASRLLAPWWPSEEGSVRCVAHRHRDCAWYGLSGTWNCKHIANARMLRFVMETCRAAAYEPPVICTPEELIEE